MAKSEPGSDASSLRSAPKTPSEAGGAPRRVGFAPQRPTLWIPPPGVATPTSIRTVPITAFASPTPQALAYSRKASIFVFDQFSGLRNAARSGLGFGEKCAYWIYNKFSSWSRKWFTHAFLSIVLAIYSVGGAVMMKYVEEIKICRNRKWCFNCMLWYFCVSDERTTKTQLWFFCGLILYTVLGAFVFASIEHPSWSKGVCKGANEKRIMEVDTLEARQTLLQNLHETWNNQTTHASEREWMGSAVARLQDYETKLEEAYRIKMMRKANNGDFVWTLSNAVVYCATVYTTIGRLEALVTDEQVHADLVARRRRRFTKRRASSREATPARAGAATTSEEDAAATPPRPRTPERRRRPRRRASPAGAPAPNETVAPKEPKRSNTLQLPLNTFDTPTDEPPIDEPIENHESFIENLQQKRENLVEIAQTAQAEFLAFLGKTKKSISNAAARGRDRFRKDKERVKRSQSAPHQFTEEELLESFKRAQMLSVEPSLQPRKYSDTSLRSLTPEVPLPPKPFRPEVQEFVRQRKKQRSTVTSTKIIEVLDPETSEVVATKAIVKKDFKLRELLSIFRLFSIREIFRSYKEFKISNKHECLKIKNMYKRCMLELFLIMLFCGCGGMVFKATEGSFENYYKCGVKRVKRDFLDLLWIKSHNLREDDWKSLARNRLRTFEEELHAAHEAGMTSYSGQRSWSFLNGVVYCLTVVTTIGYGHLYPTTVTGKSLTIVYAIIGIPLFLIALTDFGKLFTRCIKFFWSYVRRLYYTGSCRSVRKTAHVQEIFKGAQLMYDIATFRRPSHMDPEAPMPPPSHASGSLTTPTTPAIEEVEIDDEFNLPISVALSILVAYIFCGAVLYMVWEQWNFFDAFYFVFISMSTIGFGDYVPSSNYLMVVSIVYLVFGLALMSMCINVVQVKLSDTFKQASAKIGATFGVTVADDGSVYAVPPDPVELVPVHSIDVLDATPPSPSHQPEAEEGETRSSPVENGVLHVVEEDRSKDS